MAIVVGIEVWKSVVGHEGWYEVSNMGMVRRIAGGNGTHPMRLVKSVVGRNGYRQVSLCLCGKRTTYLVAHLVADAFLPPKSPTDTVVRHLNDDPSDNRAVNLARGTHKDNAADAIRNGRRCSSGITNYGAKLTEDNVREIRRLYATGNFTQAGLASRFGIRQGSVSVIVRRRTWKHVV
jgi:hypothetical protein